jgi:hypothetical protein
MKIQDKKYFGPKNTKGGSLQIFFGSGLKINTYFTKVVDD